MKNILSLVLFLLTIHVGLAFSSCSSSDGDEKNGEENVNPQNKAFVGTKWVVNDVDWSFGDDWAGSTRWTVQVYFYSQTEGLVYVSDYSNYSDVGSSTSRMAAYFIYEVEDGGISLDYITDEFRNMPSYLNIENGELLYNSTVLTKEYITSSDKTWLNTICGTTGECKWYHDILRKLYIVGDGKMADYSSASSTPWNSRSYNSLEVKDGVTHIGNYAFAHKSLGNVDMPYSSLESIGNYAFTGSCISSIKISNNTTTIGDGAFYDCSYLGKVYMPDNLEHIGAYAFSGCGKAELSFLGVENVRTIGEYAFAGAKVTRFENMEALEEVGMGAFTNLSVKKLVLPNTYTSLNNVSFMGSFSEIRLGTGITSVVGTPFYPATTGKMYVNLGVPLDLEYDIIDPSVVKNWTLYVPKGSKTAYSKADYWKKFKSIVEDSSLESGNGTPDDSDDDDDTKVYDKETLSYEINGVTYKMILVDNGNIPAFRIMQTELPHNCNMVVNGHSIRKLNSKDDNAVIKAEFRNFLNELRDETGTAFRLPTRKEWELAARGGKTTSTYIYSGSNDADEVAWHSGNSKKSVHDIAQKKANELGIYDMSGNYAEVCNESDDIFFVDGPICGGSWNDDASNCKVSSWKDGSQSGKIQGTVFKEKNAFDARYITVRLVYTVPNK